jgi:hypothetical protein
MLGHLLLRNVNVGALTAAEFHVRLKDCKGRNLRNAAVRATGHVSFPLRPTNTTKEPSAGVPTSSQQSYRFILYTRVLLH